MLNLLGQSCLSQCVDINLFDGFEESFLHDVFEIAQGGEGGEGGLDEVVVASQIGPE